MYSGVLRKNYDLSCITWFKVGGPCNLFFKPQSIDELSVFLSRNDMKVATIGAGSNILVRDNGFDGVIIKLGSGFNHIVLEGTELRLGCGASNYSVSRFCYENSLTGLEFLSGIPGTIGGGIATNAGAYGREFKDIIANVKAISYDGSISILESEHIGFHYRGNSLANMIFLEATVNVANGNKDAIGNLMRRIKESRETTQPIHDKTCGSTFRNPDGNLKAWELIRKSGMNSVKVGGAMFSPKHANFMINCGDAKASDLEALGELARARIYEFFGVRLNWEIRIIGY